jgi:hypothetical protein
MILPKIFRFSFNEILEMIFYYSLGQNLETKNKNVEERSVRRINYKLFR